MSDEAKCTVCGGPHHDEANRAGLRAGEMCVRYLAARLSAVEARQASDGAVIRPPDEESCDYCEHTAGCHAFDDPGNEGHSWCIVEGCSCGDFVTAPAAPPVEPAPEKPGRVSTPEAYEAMRAALAADAGYRHTWVANIAMVLHDRHGITGYAERNAAGEDIMNQCFPLNPPYPAPSEPSGAEPGYATCPECQQGPGELCRNAAGKLVDYHSRRYPPAAPQGTGEGVSHREAREAARAAADPVRRHNGCLSVLDRYVREREAADSTHATLVEIKALQGAEVTRLRAELAALRAAALSNESLQSIVAAFQNLCAKCQRCNGTGSDGYEYVEGTPVGPSSCRGCGSLGYVQAAGPDETKEG